MGRRSRIVMVGVALLLLVVAVLVVASPIDPEAWTPGDRPALSGPLSANLALRDAEVIGSDLDGPEDVAVDTLGRVYTGLADGTIRRWDPAGAGAFESFAVAGGRPMGLDFDDAGRLWVADGSGRLLSIDPHGRVAVHTTVVDGRPLGLLNDVDAGPRGRIYFSESTVRRGPDELHLEALEARAHGSLLEYDPVAETTRVLLDGLHFANGVAVALDGSFVLVNETFRYRTRRLWLTGPRAGSDEILLEDLPGFPDGVASDRDGRFWLALFGPRSATLDRLHRRPWLKRLVAWYPADGGTSAERYGLVLAFDADGRVLHSLHDPGGERIAAVSSVEPAADRLYLGTTLRSGIGRCAKP